MLFQIKKQKRDQGRGVFRIRNATTSKILAALNEQNLQPQVIEGEAR